MPILRLQHDPFAFPAPVDSPSSCPSPQSTSLDSLPSSSRRRSTAKESSRSQRQSRKMSSIKAQASPEHPIERASSPYPDPRQLGPKSKILATRTSNFHSTSLRMVTATSPTVNRTCQFVFYSLTFPSLAVADPSPSIALHPGGVLPIQEHTDLENELHEKAHIDYDRVAIVRRLEPPASSLPPPFALLPLTIILPPGSQSLRCCPLRRCPSLRNWLCHHIYRGSHRILRSKDWSFASGQENRQGAWIRERNLVGVSFTTVLHIVHNI